MTINEEMTQYLLSLGFKRPCKSRTNIFTLDDQLLIVPENLTIGHLLAIRRYLDANGFIDGAFSEQFNEWVSNLKEKEMGI